MRKRKREEWGERDRKRERGMRQISISFVTETPRGGLG